MRIRSLLFANVAAAVASPTSQDAGSGSSNASSLSSKIKNVVLLVMENRSFDSFAGGWNYSQDIDNLVRAGAKEYCNPFNVNKPDQKTVCALPLAQDIASDDPEHGISGVNMQLFGTYHPTPDMVPDMQGFVTEQATKYAPEDASQAAEAINYYAEEHTRVVEAIAEDYVLFDRWFAGIPGPTAPNRVYITAGTSHGHGTNDAGFVGGLPMKSIFQALTEAGIEWRNYQNQTNLLQWPPTVNPPDPLFFSWTVTHPSNWGRIKGLDQFYKDAAAGKLPPFTFINPECCNYQSFHPPSPVTTGSQFVKGIFEALRASPQWEDTLFIMTFDEHGGFGDHVVPPSGVPAPDAYTYTEKTPDGSKYTFDFTRLGVRVPTIIASPWLPKAHIEHKGRNYGQEYTHTSIIHFLNNLWGINLSNPRIAWSSTWEDLFLESPRADVDMARTLPDAYPF